MGRGLGARRTGARAARSSSGPSRRGGYVAPGAGAAAPAITARQRRTIRANAGNDDHSGRHVARCRCHGLQQQDDTVLRPGFCTSRRIRSGGRPFGGRNAGIDDVAVHPVHAVRNVAVEADGAARGRRAEQSDASSGDALAPRYDSAGSLGLDADASISALAPRCALGAGETSGIAGVFDPGSVCRRRCRTLG